MIAIVRDCTNGPRGDKKYPHLSVIIRGIMMTIRATYLDQSSYNYIFSRCISSLESIQDSFFRCDNWYQNDMPQIIVNICTTR